MPSKFYEQLGAHIKERRQRVHLRQAELAETVGMSRTSITNIERGRQRLFLDQFTEICRALDVPPSELIPAGVTWSAADRSEKIVQTPASVQRFLASIDLGDEGRG